MGSFGLTDIVGNTFGYSRVIVYGADGKIKFPTGGGGGGGVTSIDVNGGTGISVSPAGPITTSGTFTVTNTAPDLVVSLATTGTGLAVTGTYPNFTLENTLPDQTVVLTAGAGISITGTYPSFTISASGSSGMPYGIASGTNNYTVTIPGVTGYVDGDAYIIKFTNGNDADSDININSLGVKNLVKEFNVQLTGGDIVSGQDLIIIYDGTNFQTLGVAPNQLFAYVTNDDSVTITKGQPVYAFGAAGNRMSVKLASNVGDATSAQTVGLVFSTSIAPNQRGFVICQGVLSGVNTAAYSPGNQLYLGATAGTLTATKPFAPNHLVYIGIVERANVGNGQIYVKPQNGYEMNELHDVQSNGAVNNDILYRDTTVTPNLWKPASIPTILGYTPANAAADLTQISVSTANAREDNYAPTGWPGTTDRVKVIRIDSTNTNYMMSLGGLANPSAGRIVTIYNNSAANNLIIIENLSTSSTAANRFRMTSGLPYFLLPTRSITFIYDGTYWTQLSSAPFGGLDFFEDFLQGPQAGAANNTTITNSTIFGADSGIVARSGAAGEDEWGTSGLSTGTTATGGCGITMNVRRTGGNSGFGANAATNTVPYLTVGKLYLAALATVAQNYNCYFGINNKTSLALVSGATLAATGLGYYWRYAGSGSSVWDVVTQTTAGSTVTTATSISVTTNNIWLGIYKVGGANTRDAIFFYSTDGIIYQSAFKFVGITSTIGGFPAAAISSTAGTTGKELRMDWFGASFNLSR